MIEYGHLGWYWEKQSVNNTNARVKICSMQPSLTVFSENETILIRSENYPQIITINIETLGKRFKLDIIPGRKIDLVNEILEKIKENNHDHDWNDVISKWGFPKSEYMNSGTYSSKIYSVLLATVSCNNMNDLFIPNDRRELSKKKLQIRCDCSFNFRESIFSEQGRILRMPLTFEKFRIRNNRGVMKMWDSKKGFGFIEQEEGKDLFCHITRVKSEYPLGLEVEELYEFEENKNEKGWFAESVEAIYLDREDYIYNSLRSKNKEWMKIVDDNNSLDLTIELSAEDHANFVVSSSTSSETHHKSGEEIVTEAKPSFLQIIEGKVTFNSVITCSDSGQSWIWKVDPFCNFSKFRGRSTASFKNKIVWDHSDPLNPKLIAKSLNGTKITTRGDDESVKILKKISDEGYLLTDGNFMYFELEYSGFEQLNTIEISNNSTNEQPYYYLSSDGKIWQTTEEEIIDEVEVISITEESCKMEIRRINYKSKKIMKEEKEFLIKKIAENKKEQILDELNNTSPQSVNVINRLLQEYFEVELIAPIQSWLERIGCHEKVILSPRIPKQIHDHSKMKLYTLSYTLAKYGEGNRIASIGGNHTLSLVIDRIEYREIDSDGWFDGDSDVLDLFDEQGNKISIRCTDIKKNWFSWSRRTNWSTGMPLDSGSEGFEFISKEIKSYEFRENWTVVIETSSNFESSPNTKNRLGVTTIY